VLAMLVCAGALTSRAQAEELRAAPAPLALKLMLRTLAFDQRFSERGSGDFVVLVLSEPGQEAARDEALAATEELKSFKILSRALRFLPVALHGEAGLRDDVKRLRASALLVLPGLSDGGLEAVTRVAVQAQLYTMSLEPSLVQRTILLGVFEYQGRPRIALNQAAMHALDIDFEKTLLRVAEMFPGTSAPNTAGRPKPDF